MAGEWHETPLGAITDFLSGGTPSKDRPDYWIGSVPWVSAKDMKRFRLDDTEDHLSEDGVANGTKLVPPGSVLLLARGMTLLNDVPICVISRSMAFNQDVKALRPKPHLRSDFLPYLLLGNKERLLSLVDLAGHGTGRLNSEELKALDVVLPPAAEQRAIAHILGTLDDKIELNRRMSETLEAMARALFKSWFVDFDPVRATAEGWKFEEMGNHVESSRGFSYDGASIASGGVPFHNLNSIFEGGGYKFEGIKSLSGEFDDRRAVEPGDIIVANTEQGHDRLLLGSAALIPQRYGPRTPFSHHLYRIRVRPGSPLCSVYVLHLLNDPQMHDLVSRYGNGTTVNMLPADALQLPIIAVPPASDVARFEAVALPMHHRAEAAVLESEHLSALRDALLPKLISGELRLKDAERIAARAV